MKRNYNLSIKLKSDLCTSSGESMGSFIDNDVCYDNYGIPYIPAKRIKGLLREITTEYLEWQENSNVSEIINEIFGAEGERNPGKLKIENAYIENYETIINELEYMPENYERYIARQKIIETFTYTRYQNAIDDETGASKDGCFRSSRVVRKGNEFIAKIEITEDEQIEEILKNSAILLTHIGMNRTRGYGEVKCRMILDNTQNVTDKPISIDFDDETDVKVKLILKANSELMVSKQNAEISQNYIPGSNILGSIAKKYIEDNNVDFENSSEYINLFLNGDVKYSNAYISNSNGLEFYPIPFSYAKVKNTDNRFFNKMFDIKETVIQLSAMTDKFVTFDSDYLTDVEMSENYHHQRPKDKSIGHVLQGEDGGTLYQYTAIGKKQYFWSTITGKAKWIKLLTKYINKGEILRVGKSKTAEYGALEIVDIKVEKDEKPSKQYKKFAVILTSDTIIMDNENASATTNKDNFINKIKSILGSDVVCERAFINYEKVSGYNVLWNMPKEQLEAFKAGSVFVFESQNGIQAKDCYNIGQRQNEGYGNIKLIDISNKNEVLNLKKYVDENKKISLEEMSINTKKLLKKSIIATINEDILAKAIEKIEDNCGLNNTTIGRILLMLQQSKNVDDFVNNVSSIKDIKKKAKVNKLLENRNDEIDKLKSIIDLREINSLINEQEKAEEFNSYVLEYLKQCFIQAKLGGDKK